MLKIRVSDTLALPSFATRLGTVTLAGALGKASEADVQARVAADKWLGADSLGQFLVWLASQTGIMPAAQLGVITGDVDTYEAANTTAINTYLAGGTYRTVMLGPLYTRVSGEILVPPTCKLLGWGYAGSILKSNALAAPVVRATQLAQLEGLTIDATTARRAAGTADGDGVLVSGGDEVPLDSNFQQIWTQLRVINQPRDGIHIIGQNQSSSYRFITTAENLRHGFVIEDGTFSGYTNKSQAGMFDIFHLRSNNNGGFGFMGGSIGQVNDLYRVEMDEAELNDNACNPAHMPILQGPNTALGSNPIATTIGSPDIVITFPAGGHQAIRGHHVTLSGATAVGGFSTGDLNKTHRCSQWLSDLTARITMPTNASSTASGGGAAVLMTLRVGAQAFLSGNSHRVVCSAFGDTRYDETTTPGGQAKTAQLVPTGAVYLYACSRTKFEECRYITVGYGWACDMQGTPSGNVATSLCDAIYEEGYFHTSALTNGYLFYIPSGASGCTIKGDVHSGATALAFSRDVTARFERAGVWSRTIGYEASPGGRWQLGAALSTHVIASGALLTSNDRLLLQGEGDTTDTLDSINAANMPPSGYETTVINAKAYNITLAHGTGAGNFELKGNVNEVLAPGEARRLISLGEGTHWMGIGA